MKILFFLIALLFFPILSGYAEIITPSIPYNEKSLIVDEQIMIMADISNSQDNEQSFAYLTQIKNEEGVVISLSWLAGSLSPHQSFSPAQSWIPTETGTFHVQIFVWESIDNPEALSPSLSMLVHVTERGV